MTGRGITRTHSHDNDHAGGGTLPSLRTTYSLAQRLALWDLAMSNPTRERYDREKARILGSAA